MECKAGGSLTPPETSIRVVISTRSTHSHLQTLSQLRRAGFVSNMQHKRHKSRKADKPNKARPPLNFWCRDCNKLHVHFKWQMNQPFKPRCTNCGGPLLSSKEARDAKPASTTSTVTKNGSADLPLKTASIVEPSGYGIAGLQKADQTIPSAMQSEM